MNNIVLSLCIGFGIVIGLSIITFIVARMKEWYGDLKYPWKDRVGTAAALGLCCLVVSALIYFLIIGV